MRLCAKAKGVKKSACYSSDSVQGFIGALGTGPTTFWLPSIIYLVLKKPGMNNWNFWASYVCIFLGVAVTILGSIGGMRGIIVDASCKLPLYQACHCLIR